jgi:predicted permease
MWKDLAFSLRILRRSPVFAAVATLSLALGIGANTAIFSLLSQVVLRSLPVDDPERLVVLHTDYNHPGTSTKDVQEAVFSYPMYRDLRDRDAAFAGMIARSGGGVTLRYGSGTESVSGEIVSGNFFRVLGVGAAVGRVLLPEDDGAPGANPVAVLSHAYWTSRFGASAAILNRTVTLNGHPFMVVGVVEPRFRGMAPGNSPDLFVPISMELEIRPTWDALENRQMAWLNIFARLKPGVPMAQAQAATGVVYRSILEAELPGLGGMKSERGRAEFLNHRVTLLPAAQGINELGRQWARPIQVLMAMVGLVLLIACANVAALTLARATGRRREIAIRLALGAGRLALVRQLLLEGLVLALAGGAAGLLMAAWGVRALVGLLPPKATEGWLTSGIDFRLLAFNMALAAVCGLLFGLIPALQATHPNLATALKEQASAVASGGGAARFRKALVVGQVALSLLLAAGAGLFTMSLLHLARTNLGFHTERLLTFPVNASLNRPDLPQAVAYYRDLLNRLQSMGGAAGVGAADGGPFSGSSSGGNMTVEGYQAGAREMVGGSMVAVSPGFFEALRIPLRAGREFSERDDGAAPKAVVINEAFARRYFAGRNPLGRRLMWGADNKKLPDREIVGVVADFRTEVREPANETVYYPYPQWEKPARMMFYVRAAGNPNSIAPDIRALVRAADPGIPAGDLKPIEVRIQDSIFTDRLIAWLSVAFGVLATLLAALGIYGVVAYAVERRTAEMGIRMALGATGADVLRMVLLEAGRMAGAGIVVGLAGAVALGRLLKSQLFGVEAADPAILLAAAGLLCAVALGAAWIPGRRAARIDPVSALKYE